MIVRMLFVVLCFEDDVVDRVRVWGERRQDQGAHDCGRGGGERRRAGHRAHFERGATGTGAGMQAVAGSHRKKGATMGRRGGSGARAGRK
jgi:hypothetical protein